MAREDPRCFYLTPFDKKTPRGRPRIDISKGFDDVYTALSSQIYNILGLDVVRLKELARVGVFWDKIREEINCASCVIADLTGNNLNVLIEVGVALQAHKRLVLITRDAVDKVPSNIKQYHVITYANTKPGRKVLANKVVDELRDDSRILSKHYLESHKNLHLIPGLVHRCFESDHTRLLQSIPAYILNACRKHFEGGSGGVYEFTPDQYPGVLSFIQEECNPIIEAVSIVEGEDAFWPSFWGHGVLQSTNKRSTRIFIFQVAGQIYKMHHVLRTHAARYRIKVGTTRGVSLNPSKDSLDCILFYENERHRKQRNPSLVGYYHKAGLKNLVVLSSEATTIGEYTHAFDVLDGETKDIRSYGKTNADHLARKLFGDESKSSRPRTRRGTKKSKSSKKKSKAKKSGKSARTTRRKKS